jgi:two-component system, cell cycle sensor histidine kinase and response regulator CckA
MAEALRLFLVEDDDNIALVIRRYLERAGHQVTVCHTAADALIVLSHNHDFHLVLLDLLLMDMSGLDLLQAMHREGITTPVLVVTGKGDEQKAADVLRAGALDYVAKDPALTFLAELPKRVTESVTRHRLLQLNRLLIEALESARDGIMITDLQGKLLHVNGALVEMTGYTREELLGQTPRLFKSGLHPPAFFAAMWGTILNRDSWHGELINRRKDGTLFDASLTVSPIVDARGALTHFVGIYRDISERKHLQRQLLQAQKMQSVGTLAGGVAHEFNNLLAGIQGYADLGLREAGLTPPLREFLQFIVQLAHRAANLTRALLAYARKPALSRQPTRMARLVQGTADLVRHSLRLEVALEVEEDGPEGEPLSALADANQLQQVLVNLALNARDALSEPAPVTFRLRRRLLEGELPAFPENVPPGDYAVLEVEDRGQGMTAEVLSQALDPFFTTKEVGQGTGLGLPVAFGIVHGHQGYLTIDTQPGRGTRVGLYLPRLIGAVPAPQPDFEAGQVLEPEAGPRRTILVIDDEEAVLDVVRRFLEIAGHLVICTTTGQEAVALLAGGRVVDLVILDLMIPREEGATTLAALRQRRPGIPVLVCTGLLQTDPAPPLLKEPGVALLRKPFRMNELWYAVNQILAGT